MSPKEPATPEPKPAPVPKEPTKPKVAVVLAPYQHRILFANEPLEANASNASIAIDTWTLGDPLYIHAYGPAPERVVLYAEVNGEPAGCTDQELVLGVAHGALGHVDLKGDGEVTPVQGDLGPQASGVTIASPSTHYAGVWTSMRDYPPWARVWQEFHNRIIPMLHVGDNTLKLTLADDKRTETFAEGTVTIKVPSEAAFKAELAANVEESLSMSGDPATLREIEKLVRAAPHLFRDIQIVRVAYVSDKWKKAYDGRELVSASMDIDVIHRKPGDKEKHPARCRVIGVTVMRKAEGSPETKLGKMFLDARTLEIRWTPCP